MNVAVFRFIDLDVEFKVWHRHHARGVLRPFAQLQAGAGKEVAKTSVFPLAWVADAVKIKMPHVTCSHGVGFDHGIGGAFDATFDSQSLQHVTHQSGFACAQIAMQSDASVQVDACQCGS